MKRLLLSMFAVVCLSSSAWAANPQAETLFQEGRRAATAKEWDKACRLFAESHRLEPAPGTLLNLGDCEENRKRYGAAIDQFETAARLFRAGDDRIEYAQGRAKALRSRMPRLTLRLHEKPTSDVTITLDGSKFDKWGTPTAVDPGSHQILVSATGYTDARTTVRLGDNESREIELSVGLPISAGAATPAQPVDATATSAAPTSPPPVTMDGSPASTTRILGYGLLGLGAVGVGVGIFGGIKVIDSKSTVDANCSPTCNAAGNEAKSSGRTWSAIGTASLVTGVLAMGGGAALLLWGGSSKANTGQSRVQVAAGPLVGGAEVGVSGRF